ncbi:MAG TPA: hypothetical protein VM638_05790 [Actinomycetota bacterium]|nr:hypothetical protein [Actinomycetota bacterium]
MERFLVVYDTGQGGAWAYLRARSRAEIYMRFPELEVVDRPPGWMSPEVLERIEREMTADVDEDRDALIARLRARPAEGPVPGRRPR